MSIRPCNVCGAPLGAPVYASPADVSITSLCEIINKKTKVFFCARCGHLLTPEIGDLTSYYDGDYKILVNSDDEDQLYELGPNGEKLFRADHQLSRLLEKVPLRSGSRALDWGCAKGTTFRRLSTLRSDLALHLFDVSEMYLPFWKRFSDPSRWATYVPPPEWTSTFDLVTSFYSLEHIASPRETISDIARVLAPGGRLYLIVPDTYQNVGDFVVADHVNHFSKWSLQHLLTTAGLRVLELDTTIHQSAIVAIAEKRSASTPANSETPPADLASTVNAMADYWRHFGERVRSHERLHTDRRAAIYGSGFYGTFVTSCLRSPERVAAYLDQNPFRQGMSLLGKPILAPDALPLDIDLIYVGLNPERARGEIAKIATWSGRSLDFFYP